MIDFLGQLVSFPSVSSDPGMAVESRKTAEFIREKLVGLGAEVNIVDNKMVGKNPLLMGKLGDDPTKKTILVYSHYDVQPASKEDGWDTEPFDMQKKEDGYLYGRGCNDDKGPITATYFAVKSFQGNLPVNVRFLYEGEEESSSGGFEDTVEANRDFFGNVDGILILDTSWFNDEQPSVDYGFRGITYMGITLSGPKADQHSGLGGTIREPMIDLVNLMSTLISPKDGKILIEGFYNDVAELTFEEKALYSDIQFNLDEFRKYLGRDILLHDDEKLTLMNMWRNPCLSLHGIEGAFSGPGSKTVVPAKVTGKVSMRLVPDQDPQRIADLFKTHVEKEFEKLDSPNELDVETLGTGAWWYGKFDNFLYQSASKAIEEYWNMKPLFTRSGGSIPIIPFMENIFDAPAIGIGVGQLTDGAHSQNERIRIKNLVGAKDVIANTLQHIANGQ